MFKPCVFVYDEEVTSGESVAGESIGRDTAIVALGLTGAKAAGDSVPWKLLMGRRAAVELKGRS